MRSLSAPLLAAQKAKSSKPYLLAQFFDTCAFRRRLRWTSCYSGAEAAGPHCAVLGSDGSLNRFRVAAGSLYRQRVASPAPGSDFSVWTLVSTNRGAAAVTRYGATIELYAVRTDGGTPNREVWLYVSADDGASWGAGALVFTAPVAINYLAVGSKSDGTVLAVFDNGVAVRKIKRVATVWGAQANWTNTAASLTGLACNFYFDFELVVTGTEAVTLEPRVWRCIYGDGYSEVLDTWSALMVYAQAAAGLGVSFSAPFLRVASGYRFFYREAYTGLGAYDRIMHTSLANGAIPFSDAWREAEPFDLTATYGLALAGLASGTGGLAWVSTPSRVFCSQAYLVSDLSSRLVACDLVDRPYSPDAGWMELDNADGALNWDKLGVGDLLGLRMGSEVLWLAGYVTTGGGVVSVGPSMWVTGLEYRREKLKSRLVVHLGSAFWLLDRPVVRSEDWAAGATTVYGLLRSVVGGVGLAFGALSGSGPLAALSPAFSLRPGQSRLAALVELVGLVEDEVVSTAYGYAMTVWPQKTDAVVYAYGTDHAIRSGVHREVARPGLARAFGANAVGAAVFGQALDFPALENFNVGSVRFRRAGGTAAEAATLALATLRGDDLGSRDDELVIGPNVGQEPYDVVEVTDAALGYSASKRRVRWVRLLYDADKGVYAMRLGLGGL